LRVAAMKDECESQSSLSLAPCCPRLLPTLGTSVQAEDPVCSPPHNAAIYCTLVVRDSLIVSLR
jgi:hypothetical protein